MNNIFVTCTARQVLLGRPNWKDEIGRPYSTNHVGEKRKINLSQKETESLVDVDIDGTVIQQLF